MCNEEISPIPDSRTDFRKKKSKMPIQQQPEINDQAYSQKTGSVGSNDEGFDRDSIELAGQQRFLPLSLNRLVGILLNRFELNDPQRREWYRLFDAIAKVERMHLLVNFDLMSQLYDPFDPDKTYHL